MLLLSQFEFKLTLFKLRFCLLILLLITPYSAKNKFYGILASDSFDCGDQCWKSTNPNIQNLLNIQSSLCKKNLQNKKSCDLIPDSDARKLCHPSQFCKNQTEDSTGFLKKCGWGIIDPTLNTLESILTAPIHVFHSLAKTYELCTTKPNCGLAQTSPERLAQIQANAKIYADYIKENERGLELELCADKNSNLGCPIPELSCMEWNQLITEGKTKNYSQKDGFNKGRFF